MTTEKIEKLIADNCILRMKIKAYEKSTGKSIHSEQLEKMVLLLSK